MLINNYFLVFLCCKTKGHVLKMYELSPHSQTPFLSWVYCSLTWPRTPNTSCADDALLRSGQIRFTACSCAASEGYGQWRSLAIHLKACKWETHGLPPRPLCLCQGPFGRAAWCGESHQLCPCTCRHQGVLASWSTASTPLSRGTALMNLCGGWDEVQF